MTDPVFCGRFQAFGLLTNFLSEFAPDIRHFTKEQSDAVHKHADLIAKELLAPKFGRYVYEPREKS